MSRKNLEKILDHSPDGYKGKRVSTTFVGMAGILFETMTFDSEINCFRCQNEEDAVDWHYQELAKILCQHMANQMVARFRSEREQCL